MANILMIDDDDSAIYLMKTVLEKEGFVIFEALEGDQGLQVFESNHIDLVITDVIMEFSGINLIAEIRKVRPSIPIIVVTGSLLAAATLQEQNLVAATLVKPFDNDTLVQTVKGLL